MEATGCGAPEQAAPGRGVDGPVEVRINGRAESIDAGCDIEAWLRGRGVDPVSVVVAINGAILARHHFSGRFPRAGDRIEVVRAVAGGSALEADPPLEIAGVVLRSRLFCGTGKFRDAQVMARALEASGCEVVTVAVRYFDLEVDRTPLLDHLDGRRYRLLPNTAGARTAEEAVHLAELGRAATGSSWVKLEVIGEPQSLWPDGAATVAATAELVRRGFTVLPYVPPDPVVALQVAAAGAATVMPLGSPIGSGQGVLDQGAIRRIVGLVDVPVVVDAGIGSPADAAAAMEAGAAAVLVNTAIARAQDPVRMAGAMGLAVTAGRLGHLAGRIPRSEAASPSSPAAGVPRLE